MNFKKSLLKVAILIQEKLQDNLGENKKQNYFETTPKTFTIRCKKRCKKHMEYHISRTESTWSTIFHAQKARGIYFTHKTHVECHISLIKKIYTGW